MRDCLKLLSVIFIFFAMRAVDKPLILNFYYLKSAYLQGFYILQLIKKGVSTGVSRDINTMTP